MKKTLLLVEDMALIAMAEKKELERFGYSVLTASSGEKALELFISTPGIDLVLMDINLGPGMDGTEAAARILEIRHVPIVFLSSHSEPDIVDKTEAIASYGYVTKESGYTVLNASIKMAFRLYQARQEVEAQSESRFRLISENAGDVTAHAKTREQFETIFNMSLDGMCIADINTATFLKVNPAFSTLLGYSEEELLSRSFLEFVHPDDIQPTADVIERDLKLGKTILRFENRYRTKAGEYIWLDWNSHPKPEEGITYAIAHDVTERKRTEEIIRTSEDKMRSIFRVAPTGIGVVRDRVIQEVNPTVCEITGYSQEELTGKSAQVLYPSREEYELVGKVKYAQIAQHGTGSVETKWQKKDGTIIDILLSSTPIDTSDLSKGVTFTALDITERKASEARIQHLLTEKEILLKEVHHRIKNNMIVMKSLLSLQADNVRDISAKKALETAKNRMTSMMVLYDKIYRHESKNEMSLSIYLTSLVDEIVSTYPIPVTINKAITEKPVPVQVASTIGIIVNELISNAMKYAFTESGKPVIDISASLEGKQGTVVVKDNGRGFSPEASAKGFGLELVETLASQIDGEFSVKQEDGTLCMLTFGW